MDKDINLKKEIEWNTVKIKLEALYDNKLISFDTLINALILGRMKMDLPIATRGIISVQK